MKPYEKDEDKKRFLENIQGPGGREFTDATKEVGTAYKEGGFPSAAGIAARKAPGIIAATVRDVVTPEPVRRGLSELYQSGKEFTRAAALGEITPKDAVISSKNAVISPVDNTAISDTNTINLPRKSLEQLSAPKINEIYNARRDAELGKMTSSARKLPGGGQRNTFSLGGNTISYDVGADGVPIGHKRSLQNLSNGTAAQQAEARFNSRPAVNPTKEALAQWDYQQGLKSGRYQPKTDPYAGLSARAKRELMLQESRNRQSGLENINTNKIAQDRNRILEESNIRDSQRMLEQAKSKSDSAWTIKNMGKDELGQQQNMLFNSDGRSIKINPPPVKGKGIVGAVYQSPKGFVMYKGIDDEGNMIYEPFKMD